ncbi:MAG: T9SS type A sorting domain-containing protein [Bacteroidia bacterium]|nr:T9SS type A sorting domain-containing protein [Bacteroidia bacterium]
MNRFFSFMLSLGFFGLNSQTLTQSFNEPVVGDIDVHYRLDTSAYTSGVPIHVSGNNCTWDFSKLVGNFPMVVDSFINVSAAVGGSAYPNASFVQHRDLLYTFYQSISSPQQTELLGAYSPSLSLTFTNSAIIATYPVAYGYSLTDPVAGSFKFNSTNGTCVGSISIMADGFGTAKFNGGVSIPNVLCLRSVEVLTLSIGIAQFGTFRQSVYNYYMPGRKYPILNVNYTTYGYLANPPTTTAFIYGSNDYFSGVGIEENTGLDKIQVFPNPFHNKLVVQGDLKEDTRYLFYDAKGQMMLSTSSLSESDLDCLPTGLYFLNVQTGASSYFKKVVKD